jgi:hypothetical protein
VLITAVLALKDVTAVTREWTKPPTAPEIGALEELMKTQGVTVSAIEAPGQMQ